MRDDRLFWHFSLSWRQGLDGGVDWSENVRQRTSVLAGDGSRRGEARSMAAEVHREQREH